jgi:hypothetical protein
MREACGHVMTLYARARALQVPSYALPLPASRAAVAREVSGVSCARDVMRAQARWQNAVDSLCDVVADVYERDRARVFVARDATFRWEVSESDFGRMATSAVRGGSYDHMRLLGTQLHCECAYSVRSRAQHTPVYLSSPSTCATRPRIAGSTSSPRWCCRA